MISKGLILFEQDFDEIEKRVFKKYQMLTMKPRLYLLNGCGGNRMEKFSNDFGKNNWPFLAMDIQSELEAGDLSGEERIELGLPAEFQLKSLIKKIFELFGLIVFFTILSNETRAWAVVRGAKTPQAGGVIHSDFEENFIKAEVINWKDLIDTGGFIEAREKGLVRTEGKEYVVRDGDVIIFKHG